MKPIRTKFTILIPVKPYVKRFLEINYGMPVDFTSDPIANKFFRDRLRKPDSSRDKQYPETPHSYTREVEVLISEHDFYRYGWELTKTDIIAFGRYFEDRAKFMMRNLVGVYHGIGLPFKTSIVRFQDRFYFDEDHWPYQTIKKDFYRHGKIEEIDFNTEIFQKIEKIVLRNLYSLGTISKQAIKAYEKTE